MKTIFKFFLNRWVIKIIGLATLSALIWFAGPLIALADYRPLESSKPRIIFILLINIFYIGKLGWRFMKAKNLNSRLMDGLLQSTQAKSNQNDKAGAEEVALLRKRFEEAVEVLKKSNLRDDKPRSWLLALNRQFVYELPWYVFIGAPGSGKTTALLNSGLQFPLAERFGQEVIRGIGGTRNCDWWFTNEAVLLDTAGRYTTQESHQEADSAAWSGFLQLLKKYRPRRPINGVIVTVSVADLLQQTAVQREAQANAIRKRIQELHTDLNIHFPLYVLVTKVDLLAGFMEFFGEFGKEERAQVWGASFPLSEKPDTLPLNHFNAEFSALEQRLNERLIDYLEQERDSQKRALMYAFPQQFSSLKEILAIFLNQIFLPSRYEQQPLLRGIYFTSGTQEGNPIDRIMGNLARTLQIDRKKLLPNHPTGKSFFLSRLIKEVIYSEAGLAGTNLRWERRQTSLQWGAFSLSILATISMITAWAISYSRNQTYVSKVEKEVSAVSKQVEKLPVMSTNMMNTLSALRSVQEMTKTSSLNLGSDSPPLSMGFGLYQGDKLSAASNTTYLRLLQDVFLPQIVLRIEDLLKNTNPSNLELLYEGLKAYIMLSQTEHFDPIALKSFIMFDWETSLPRDFTGEQRKILESHLDTLLSRGQLTSPLLVNTQLINSVRSIIAKIPTAERIYNRLKLQGVGENIPEFSIAKSIGPSASLIFTRASGEPLTKGVPGLYSYDGYYRSFSKAAKEVTKQLAEEEIWVLNLPNNHQNKFSIQVETRLDNEVRRLYLQNYAQTWEAFINDIRLVHTHTLQESIQLARLLSANDSPLPALLRAIVKEVTLVNNEEVGRNIIEKATDKVKSTSDKLKLLLGHTGEKIPTATMVSGPEHIVDDRFRSLRDLVQPTVPGQPAAIDAIMTQIEELYMLLTATEAALKGGASPPPSEVPTRIKAAAGRLPEPIRSMLTALSTSSISQALGEKRTNINQSLKSTVTEFCQKAIAGRYPFVKGSSLDVTHDDFIRLFSPGGMLDEFFQNSLSQYVDTSTRPWRFRKVGDAQMGIASKDLHEFYRAQIIRDVFFRNSERIAGINITFKPHDMDKTITQFILDVDGQLVKYSHGPQVPMSIQWPGIRGSSQIRLQIAPASSGSQSSQVFEGPWALLRMFDHVQIESSTQPDKFMAIFEIDGRRAQFEILTSSVHNPFRLNELAQFKCPARL